MASIREIIDRVVEVDPSALEMPDSAFREVFNLVALTEFGIKNSRTRWRDWSIERQRYALRAERAATAPDKRFASSCDQYVSRIMAAGRLPSVFADGAEAQVRHLVARVESLKKPVNPFAAGHGSYELKAGMLKHVVPEDQEPDVPLEVLQERLRAAIERYNEFVAEAVADAEQAMRELTAVLQETVPLVLPSTFVYLIALLDSFIAEALAFDFRKYPVLIANAKGDNQITYGSVFEAKSRTEIIDVIIDREVRRITNQPVEKQLDALQKRGVDLSSVDIPAAREIVSTRNIYVHHGGKVSRGYIDASRGFWTLRKKRAYRFGEIRPLDANYLLSAASLACEIIRCVREKFLKTERTAEEAVVDGTLALESPSP